MTDIPLRLECKNIKLKFREIDVPADGTCLFYSAMFSYLLPVVEDVTEFENRFIRLFGEEMKNSAEENRQRLLKYDGSLDFIQEHSVALEVLVNVHFRKGVVDFMRLNRQKFLGFISEDEFESYMEKMSDPKYFNLIK